MVPTPTNPLLLTIKLVAVEEPMTNLLAAWPAIGLMASCPHGVVVEMPVFERKFSSPVHEFVSARSVEDADPPAGVVVAITVPMAFTARNEPAAVPKLEMANLDVVAFVVVARSPVKFWRLVEAKT